MKNKLLPYGRHWIKEDDIQAVIEVLKSNWITQGPKINEFEQALANYCGSEYAVTFNSGTSALHGAYFTLGLKEGDEFITTPNTFVATANAGLYLGAKPVFVDVEKNTGNIDTSKIEKKITKNTKLIVPVHYAGHPVDLSKICKIAKKRNLQVVEDACHALGAKYKGKKIGNCKYSDMTVLSFHPVKHITTGEGGAVLTNNKNYYEKLLLFRNHGITKDKTQFKAKATMCLKENLKLNLNLNLDFGAWYYEMHFLGYNYRMTDIQAALGISQLKKLDSFVERRRQIAALYNKAFKNNPYFDIPSEKDYAYSSYHLYPIRLKDKCKDNKSVLFARLRKNGIGVQVHYIPVYWHPYYKDSKYKRGLCPKAEDFYHREISIPIYPGMKEEDVKYVIEEVSHVFNEFSQI
jgi:UDP-4-amino-4,6-dideoxy-N-acetyl-beta-L-altrosamine transaminase